MKHCVVATVRLHKLLQTRARCGSVMQELQLVVDLKPACTRAARGSGSETLLLPAHRTTAPTLAAAYAMQSTSQSVSL
jgi:hypothetical protein